MLLLWKQARWHPFKQMWHNWILHNGAVIEVNPRWIQGESWWDPVGIIGSPTCNHSGNVAFLKALISGSSCSHGTVQQGTECNSALKFWMIHIYKYESLKFYQFQVYAWFGCRYLYLFSYLLWGSCIHWWDMKSWHILKRVTWILFANT